MAYVNWSVKGREFANCNCAYGCPCQFNALPTYGNCKAVCAYIVDEGNFGDVRLDGLTFVLIYDWPGPIHEGDGQMQAVIDASADETQRDALARIVHGEETEPGSTAWAVFRTTMSQIFDPVYEPIELDIDVDGRRAKLSVPGLVESTGEPIRNPVTGAELRARIDLPNGFDFRFGETGSASSKVTGAIEMEFADRFGLFAQISLTTNGVP